MKYVFVLLMTAALLAQITVIPGPTGGGGGTGILTLNTLTADPQTFTSPDDTNVVLTITSAASNHAFTMSWTGALAKARQHAATVYTDAANTWSTGAQDFSAATSLKIPTGAGAAPTISGFFAYDTTANKFIGGANGFTKTFAFTDSDITGNAATATLAAAATALAANGANCGAGNYPLGVDAFGAVEGCTAAAGGGTVTSVGWTGGIVSIATATTTPAFTIAGTSGGIPYFSSSSAWASSAALAVNAVVLGGGAGATPASSTLTATVVKATSGVLSAATSGTDYVVPGGNVATATALAANGANCSAGSYALGVDASGAAEGCTSTGTTTRRIPMLNGQTNPDPSTGNIFSEPYTVKATNDRYSPMVWIYNDTSTDLILFGSFEVPQDFSSGAKACVIWTSTATTGNVRWKFGYRSIGGDDTTSLDQTTDEETALEGNDAAPGAVNRRLTYCLTLTDANIAAGDTMTFRAEREGTDTGNDTMAAAAIVFGWYFEYTRP